MWATILKILASVVAYLSNKQLLDAGAAQVKNNVHEAESEAAETTKQMVADNAKLSDAAIDDKLQKYYRD